jgi:hypothetical protein
MVDPSDFTLTGAVKKMTRVRFRFILITGIVLCISGMFHGALFAFPDPDLQPEKAALYRFHERVAMGSLSAGEVLVEPSIAGRIIRTLARHLASSRSRALIGIFLLAMGCLYGSYLVLPIQNPPPQGMQWVAHGFVSITMMLSGLG